MKRLLLLNLLFLPASSNAGESTYHCNIIQMMDLTQQGLMGNYIGTPESPVGNTFSIDRDTGEMIGSPFSTRSYEKVTVLDRGSKDNGYKAMVISHAPNAWVMYMYVQEYQEGPEKPFWGSEGGDRVLTGLCE